MANLAVQVEDMLGMVHDGVVKTFQMFDYDPAHPEIIQERQFIDQKLASLKKVSSLPGFEYCISL